jgi:N-methylhydantoinase A
LLDTADWEGIDGLFNELEQRAADAVSKTGVARDHVAFERSADMRYVGQGFEVNAPLPLRFGPDIREAVIQAFYGAYHEIFGHHLTNVAIEALNWRVKAVGPSPTYFAATRKDLSDSAREPRTRRHVFFPGMNEAINVPVWEDSGLEVGCELRGPALVEQSGCTTVVGPGDRFVVDAQRNLLITVSDRG